MEALEAQVAVVAIRASVMAGELETDHPVKEIQVAVRIIRGAAQAAEVLEAKDQMEVLAEAAPV